MDAAPTIICQLILPSRETSPSFRAYSRKKSPVHSGDS
jgi:hypothetical protein